MNTKQLGYSVWAFITTILLLLLLGIVISQKVIADNALYKASSYIPRIPVQKFSGDSLNET